VSSNLSSCEFLNTCQAVNFFLKLINYHVSGYHREKCQCNSYFQFSYLIKFLFQFSHLFFKRLKYLFGPNFCQIGPNFIFVFK